jgi:hypothetical protein
VQGVLPNRFPHHHCCAFEEAIQAVGATLLYALNPIEMAFSKSKAHLRKAAEHSSRPPPRIVRIEIEGCCRKARPRHALQRPV